jgi:hypothetical protein
MIHKITFKGFVLTLILFIVGTAFIQITLANVDEFTGKNKVPIIQQEQFRVSRGNPVLLIPDSTSDTVGMFDPYDGTYLGDFLTVPQIHGTLSTPINAVPGPDGNIYVSDQVQDAVFVFNSTGTFLYEYANDTDGLDNIRGIAFRGTHLFVTSGNDYVAEFDGPHSRLPDFINDGSDPYDLFFLDDGRALLADIQGSTDNVRLYHANGTLDTELFQISFPQQIMNDTVSPGLYLNAAFSGDQITDFDLDGTISQTTFFNGGRGIYRLGNGNLLATAGDGVWEIEPGTGTIIENKKGGSARFIEYYGLTQEEYTLTIIIEGNGTVTKIPDQVTYLPGTPVELTAIPDTDWIFSHWSGDLTGDTNPETITMIQNTTITAHFTPSVLTLTQDLYSEWNLITIPLENTWTAETLGQNITGCTVVTRFDGDTQTFTTHVVWTPHDNFPIVNGESYFIYCIHDTNLTMTGLPLETTTVHICQDWNLIGWYAETATTAESLGTNITDCSVVTKFDGDTQTFTTHVVWTPHDNFPIMRGMGLFIYATSESDWHGEG